MFKGRFGFGFPCILHALPCRDCKLVGQKELTFATGEFKDEHSHALNTFQRYCLDRFSGFLLLYMFRLIGSEFLSVECQNIDCPIAMTTKICKPFHFS
jgi:hypothetical protein